MLLIHMFCVWISEAVTIATKLKPIDPENFQREHPYLNPLDHSDQLSHQHQRSHSDHPDRLHPKVRHRRGFGYQMKCVPTLKYFCRVIKFKSMKQMYCVTKVTSRCTALDR